VTTYRLHTPASPDRPLEAWSLCELAELVECALAAGDPIGRVTATDPVRPGGRGLEPWELNLLLLLLLSS
jgi:hypothetical protein